MLALVKTLPTSKPVEITINGSPKEAEGILASLNSLYEVNIIWPKKTAGSAVPFRNTNWWKKNSKKGPGRFIAGTRMKFDLTQSQLSKKTGIPQSRLSEYECGKRSVSVENAKRIAKVLKCDYKRFL